MRMTKNIFESFNKHLNYLRSHGNKQEPRQIDYNI